MAYGTVNVPGAESAIETILVNGEEITPDSSKAVDITVPTAVSELDNDTGYLTEHPDVELTNSYNNAATQTLDWGATTGKVLVSVKRDDNGHVKDWTTIDFTMPNDPHSSTIQQDVALTSTLEEGDSFKAFTALGRDDNGHVTSGAVTTFTLPKGLSVAMMNITYSGSGTPVALDISEAGIEPIAIKMTNLSTYAPVAWYDGTAIVTGTGVISNVSSESVTFAGSPASYLVEIYGTKA